MSVLLTLKTKGLQALNKCPLCGSYRMHFYKSPDHFPAEESVDTGYTPYAGDKVAVQFHCGLELCISESNEIQARRCCTEIGKEKAEELNSEIEAAYEEEQEQAA